MSWLADTLERTVRTFVQAYLGAWVAISGHDFQDFWSHQVLLTGTGAAVLTILTCLGASRIGNKDDASLLDKKGG